MNRRNFLKGIAGTLGAITIGSAVLNVDASPEKAVELPVYGPEIPEVDLSEKVETPIENRWSNPITLEELDILLEETRANSQPVYSIVMSPQMKYDVTKALQATGDWSYTELDGWFCIETFKGVPMVKDHDFEYDQIGFGHMDNVVESLGRKEGWYPYD